MFDWGFYSPKISVPLQRMCTCSYNDLQKFSITDLLSPSQIRTKGRIHVFHERVPGNGVGLHAAVSFWDLQHGRRWKRRRVRGLHRPGQRAVHASQLTVGGHGPTQQGGCGDYLKSPFQEVKDYNWIDISTCKSCVFPVFSSPSEGNKQKVFKQQLCSCNDILNGFIDQSFCVRVDTYWNMKHFPSDHRNLKCYSALINTEFFFPPVIHKIMPKWRFIQGPICYHGILML